MSLLSAVLASQTANGAFPSEVYMRNDRIMDDENGFITALVLFTLLKQEQTSPVSQAIGCALDFIEACEERPFSGTFTFYPAGLPSAKLNLPLPADLDDSALCILALVHAGRRDRAWACRVLPEVFDKNRLLYTHAHPAWVRPGAFKTWLSVGADNPVDCCVNLNVLALYAYLGLTHSVVYKTALQSVLLGLKLTGLDALHMRQLAPFYAHPYEVYACIKRAVAFGATELTDQLRVFRRFEAYNPGEGSHPVCCNHWGQPVWFSCALQWARVIDADCPIPAC